MEIKNNTVLNSNQLSKIILPKNNTRNGIIMFSVIFIVAIVLGICFFILKDDLLLILTVITFIVGCFLLLMVILNPIIIKKNNSAFGDEIEYSYIFKDEEFTVEFKSIAMTSNTTVKYETLYDVMIKDNYLLIYVSNNQAYTVDINSFNNEDKDMIVERLLNHSKKRKGSKNV